MSHGEETRQQHEEQESTVHVETTQAPLVAGHEAETEAQSCHEEHEVQQKDMPEDGEEHDARRDSVISMKAEPKHEDNNPSPT